MSTTWYICKFCKRCFRYGKDLIAHKKTDHTEAYREAKKVRKRANEKEREKSSVKDNEEEPCSKKSKGQTSTNSSQDSRQLTRKNSTSNSSVSDRGEEESIISGASTCTTISDGVGFVAKQKGQKIESKAKKSVKNNSSNLSSSSKSPKTSKNSETTTNESSTFTCKYCRDWYPQQILLSEHILLVHGIDQAYHCLYCKKTYTSRPARDAHENKAHPDEKKKEEKIVGHENGQGEAKRKLYECKICGVTYVDHLRFFIHKKRHDTTTTTTKVDPIESLKKMEVKKMGSKSVIKAKERTKELSYDYECDQCHRVYQTQEQIVNHLKKTGHNSSIERTGGSDTEDKSTKKLSTEYLQSKSPKFVSTNIKSVPKKIKKSISKIKSPPPTIMEPNESNDGITLRKFQGSEIWVCNTCMFVHRNRQVLVEHVVKSHSSSEPSKLPDNVKPRISVKEEKKNTLNVKPKSRQSSLNQKQSHATMHEEAKSSQFLTEKMTEDNKVTWECNFCQKDFPYPSAALRHIVIHTGERKYKCSCGTKFLYPSDLRKHQKKKNHG